MAAVEGWRFVTKTTPIPADSALSAGDDTCLGLALRDCVEGAA